MGASLSLTKLATRDSTLERADSLGPQTSEKLDVLLNSTTVVTTHITIQKKPKHVVVLGRNQEGSANQSAPGIPIVRNLYVSFRVSFFFIESILCTYIL